MAYSYPTIDLLKHHNSITKFSNNEYVQEMTESLKHFMKVFKLHGDIVDIRVTPFTVMFDIAPQSGVSFKEFKNLKLDMEVNFGSPVEIVSSKDKYTIGIAIKDWKRPIIGFRNIMESKEFVENKYKLPIAAGMDVLGKPFIFDLAETPHLLVAGTTGSGKSTFLNDIIMSIVYNKTPAQVRFVMIDVKRIEMGPYDPIPHMLLPVVKDRKKAMAAFRWLEEEMMRRYKLFSTIDVRKIETYNEAAIKSNELAYMPRIVFIVDEYMELMFDSSKEMEEIIKHISRSARAVGIHLVLATQRPTRDVITPGIKANIPCRASFTVVDWRESKTIIDRTGAERLLGEGDMLFSLAESATPVHAQAAFVSEQEVDNVIAELARENPIGADREIL